MFLLDSQGFVRPVVFLITSLGILFFTYKKRTKWVWLTLIPVLTLPVYMHHVETTLTLQRQENYVRDYWQSEYQPETLSLTPLGTDDTYSWWELESEAGGYELRFYTDKSNGFEVVDTIWEEEPLRARRNVLEVMEMLDLHGWLEFSGDHYDVRGDETWRIELTSDHRVASVTVNDNQLLYELEDEGGNDE